MMLWSVIHGRYLWHDHELQDQVIILQRGGWAPVMAGEVSHPYPDLMEGNKYRIMDLYIQTFISGVNIVYTMQINLTQQTRLLKLYNQTCIERQQSHVYYFIFFNSCTPVCLKFI